MFRTKYVSPLAAVAATAALSLASTAALGAVVCSNTSIAVPQTLDGVYVNLVTGATGTSGNSVSGWDFNLYNYGSDKEPQVALYQGADDANKAVVWDPTSELYLALEAGVPIGPSSAFTGEQIEGMNQMSPWHAGVNRFIGVRFTNDTTSAVNYGWVNMTTTSPGGFPANIVSWCYDNTGAAINAGTTPVSLQQFSVD